MLARILTLFIALAATPALAGSGTVSVTAGSGTTFATTTDGSSYNYNRGTIWDYSAAANGLSIDSNHGALVAGEGTAGTSTGGVLSVQGVASGTALPVSAASLPLPTGAATSANQSTEITSLATIATNTGAAVPAGTNNIGSIDILGHAGGTLDGTAGSAASAVLSVQGISSMTPLLANPGTAANWGVGATGSAVPANAGYGGGDALSSEPSKATTGNLTGAFLDLTGKTVTSPFANRENMVRGSASETGTSAGTLLAGAGGSLKNYVTDVECGRTDAGTTAIYVTFSDAASTILVLPNNGGGGGNNKTFNVPLATAGNTAFTFTASSGVSTVYCSAQGFTGY